ncbi:thioredoxin family protein [Hydrogenovibrio crunogenus]|uniref:Thioredoxin family protein n=1 Tax=Hydrogenovibrio crunogenus TaxID=39765 RepID=A0A4P7P1T5_9GAMM|nr:thioredoxin fold domain-containing protein [Hydrogenovibrio crunogenus]QBZ84091.1 thioredoxin family protein [Hydrogenovibrio crunogenus]
MKLIQLFYLILLLTLGFSTTVKADEWRLNTIEDFSKLGQKAKQDKLPIAIYFNRVRCGACEKLKDAAILPMIENGLLDGYVHMVEIRTDAKNTQTRDFYGEQVKNSFFAELYNVTTFPSIVFVNGDGDEIGKRMVNSGAYDYVPYRLKKLINRALVDMDNDKRMQ